MCAFADPEQIVAELECSKTNRMLQCVAEAAEVRFPLESSIFPTRFHFVISFSC